MASVETLNLKRAAAGNQYWPIEAFCGGWK